MDFVLMEIQGCVVCNRGINKLWQSEPQADELLTFLALGHDFDNELIASPAVVECSLIPGFEMLRSRVVA